MAAATWQPTASRMPERPLGMAEFGPLAIRLAGWLALGTLIGAAAIVASRRLVGGLSDPPWFPAIVAAALAGAGLVLLSDRARGVGRSPGPPGMLARCCLLAMLGGLGLFAVAPSTAAATGVLMLGAVVGLARPGFPRWRIPATPLPLLRLRPRRQDPPPVPRATAAAGCRTGPLAGERLQWQERYRLPDGREHLRGELVLSLAAASRLATAHIGFCPAFPIVPEVSVTTDFDALEVAVTAAEVLPWGVRVECRVEDPADEPVSIPVALEVSQPVAHSPRSSPAPEAT